MIIDSIFNVFFTLILSNKINFCGYDFLFHIIPIYYIQFISITSQLQINYSEKYNNFCNFFRFFFFDIHIDKHTKYRRLLEINEIDLKDPIIHFKLAIFLWFLALLLYNLLYIIYYGFCKCFNKTATLSYTNNILKILLITYCSLSTITLNYLIYYNTQDNLSFVISIAYTILFIIGLPIAIIYKLEKNKLLINVDLFEHHYNSLYYIYKHSKYRFCYYLFIKNIAYSIAVSIHHSITQNSLLLLINIIYFYLIVKHQPHLIFRYKIQSYISSISTIIILLLNYIVIFYESKVDIISSTMVLIHCVTMIMYGGPIVLLICIKIHEKITHKKIDQKYIDLIANFEYRNYNNRYSPTYINQRSVDVPEWAQTEYKEKSKIIEKINEPSNIPKWAKKDYIISNTQYKD